MEHLAAELRRKAYAPKINFAGKSSFGLERAQRIPKRTQTRLMFFQPLRLLGSLSNRNFNGSAPFKILFSVVETTNAGRFNVRCWLLV